MGKCKLVNYFGWPPDIGREKLFRYAKCGRPGVKTEYNENYRDWRNAFSKYDHLSVSVYSQEELKKKANADKIPPTGWPCREFNVTVGEQDETVLEPMDPYSDEWFDNFDLATALKVKAAKLQERPKPQSRLKTNMSETQVSRGSSNADFRQKMINVKCDINNARNKGCNCYKKSKPCPKRKQAWVSCENDDCPNYPVKSAPKQTNKAKNQNAISRQSSRIGEKPISRQSSVVTKQRPISRQASFVPSKKPISRQVSTVSSEKTVSRKPSKAYSEISHQASKTSVRKEAPKKVVVLNPFMEKEVAPAELYKELEKWTNITQHKPFEPKVTESDSVLSFCSVDTSRPPSAKSTVYKQIPPSGEMKEGVKKATFSGDKAAYKHLTNSDMQLMRDMYNKVVERHHKKYINKAYTQDEENQKLFDEAKRTTQYPYSRGATQDWKTKHIDDYCYYDSYFDEVEKKRNPYYMMDNDIFNMRTRANFKKAQTLYGEEFEDKGNHPLMPADNKLAKGDRKQKDEKTYSGRTYTAAEREKIIADGNKLMERQSKNQSTVDSRWKSYDAYQNWNPYAEKETPIWAEKTFKSLGSGFWNLPFNKDDDWKKREQLSEIERNRLRQEAKICPAPKTPEEIDPFLARYYPEIRTNPIFMSQYLRNYYRRPLAGEEPDE